MKLQYDITFQNITVVKFQCPNFKKAITHNIISYDFF